MRERIRIVEPAELIQADPKTQPGANKLLAAMKTARDMLPQEISELIHQTTVPPSNAQANIEAKQRQLKALDEKIAALIERSGSGEQVIGPAWEQRALERLFEVGVRKEPDLATDLDDDVWDVAAWCDKAAEAELIEQMGSSMAPRRHWVITDKGRESIGYPSAR